MCAHSFLYKLVANLSAENFSDVLSDHTSGVYFGWASLLTRGIYKMVMSIGWNPYFDNTEKTIVSVLYLNWRHLFRYCLFQTQDFIFFQEPWLLHEFEDDFYGEELRLVIVGYIRPEVGESKLVNINTQIGITDMCKPCNLSSTLYRQISLHSTAW